MKRLFQYTMGVSVTAVALGFGLVLQVERPARAQGNLPKLPVIHEKKHKDFKQDIPGSKVSFDMVAVPGGIYLMGSPTTEKDRNKDEGPQHPVEVKPFWMGKCEVTWDEYDLYWRKLKPGNEPKTPPDKAAAAVTKPTNPYMDETFGHGRHLHPVLNVTHHAAMMYCAWLSAKTGKNYRLATEAEWEWACRAGSTTAYCFGDDPKELGEYAWYDDNSDEKTHEVGTKKANAWGLHDMHGNLAEWCLDMYEEKAYTKYPVDKIALMPVLLPTEKRYPHVVRGGSWIDPAKKARSAARFASNADFLKRDPQNPQSIWWMTDADFVGFRIVCGVDDPPELRNLKSKVTKESP
jgi:formylglycine-generating enzyme required for sulfatase activity